MANLTLVSQDQYAILDGVKRLHHHLDMLGLGYGYARAIPHLARIPVLGRLYEKSGLLNALGTTE